MHAERRGSSIDVTQVVSEGDASVTLSKLKVVDEGTYICTVSVGLFHAQQVIQLHVIRKFRPDLSLQANPHRMSCKSSSVLFVSEPPHVSLSQEKLGLNTNSRQTLSCHCAKYYPLDAKVCNQNVVRCCWTAAVVSAVSVTVVSDLCCLCPDLDHKERTHHTCDKVLKLADIV